MQVRLNLSLINSFTVISIISMLISVIVNFLVLQYSCKLCWELSMLGRKRERDAREMEDEEAGKNRSPRGVQRNTHAEVRGAF